MGQERERENRREGKGDKQRSIADLLKSVERLLGISIGESPVEFQRNPSSIRRKKVLLKYWGYELPKAGSLPNNLEDLKKELKAIYNWKPEKKEAGVSKFLKGLAKLRLRAREKWLPKKELKVWYGIEDEIGLEINNIGEYWKAVVEKTGITESKLQKDLGITDETNWDGLYQIQHEIVGESATWQIMARILRVYRKNFEGSGSFVGYMVNEQNKAIDGAIVWSFQQYYNQLITAIEKELKILWELEVYPRHKVESKVREKIKEVIGDKVDPEIVEKLVKWAVKGGQEWKLITKLARQGKNGIYMLNDRYGKIASKLAICSNNIGVIKSKWEKALKEGRVSQEKEKKIKESIEKLSKKRAEVISKQIEYEAKSEKLRKELEQIVVKIGGELKKVVDARREAIKELVSKKEKEFFISVLVIDIDQEVTPARLEKLQKFFSLTGLDYFEYIVTRTGSNRLRIYIPLDVLFKATTPIQKTKKLVEEGLYEKLEGVTYEEVAKAILQVLGGLLNLYIGNVDFTAISNLKQLYWDAIANGKKMAEEIIYWHNKDKADDRNTLNNLLLTAYWVGKKFGILTTHKKVKDNEVLKRLFGETPAVSYEIEVEREVDLAPTDVVQSKDADGLYRYCYILAKNHSEYRFKNVILPTVSIGLYWGLDGETIAGVIKSVFNNVYTDKPKANLDEDIEKALTKANPQPPLMGSGNEGKTKKVRKKAKTQINLSNVKKVLEHIKDNIGGGQWFGINDLKKVLVKTKDTEADKSQTVVSVATIYKALGVAVLANLLEVKRTKYNGKPALKFRKVEEFDHRYKTAIQPHNLANLIRFVSFAEKVASQVKTKFKKYSKQMLALLAMADWNTYRDLEDKFNEFQGTAGVHYRIGKLIQLKHHTLPNKTLIKPRPRVQEINKALEPYKPIDWSKPIPKHHKAKVLYALFALWKIRNFIKGNADEWLYEIKQHRIAQIDFAIRRELLFEGIRERLSGYERQIVAKFFYLPTTDPKAITAKYEIAKFIDKEILPKLNLEKPIYDWFERLVEGYIRKYEKELNKYIAKVTDIWGDDTDDEGTPADNSNSNNNNNDDDDDFWVI